MDKKPQICIVGGGMITQVQILPSIYQAQRLGIVGEVSVCALNSAPLKVLAYDQTLKRAFPGHGFLAYPSVATDPKKTFPDLFKDVISEMPKGSIVVVAVPDQVHYPVVKAALAGGQHVCCV